MNGHHFPSPVTTIFTRRVRPGAEAAYEEWVRSVSRVARDFPGHQGVAVLGPHGVPAEYHLIVTFDTAANLERWMGSADRRRWLEEADRLTLDDAEVRTLTGLEPWFILPSRAVNQAPPRWKMAVLTAAGVYPMLLGLGALLQPVTGGLPVWARLGVTLAVGIPLMTWGIMPLLTRVTFRWLYPEPARGASR